MFVVNDGAKLTVNNSTITNGHPAIVIVGTLSVANSTFTGNIGNVASIVNLGTFTVTNSTFARNSGSSGGAIFNNGTLSVTNSTFSDNSATGPFGRGGGILNGLILTVTNTTFTGNSAHQGGAIIHYGSATITNSTFTENSADRGGGIYNASEGPPILQNTILANNAGGNCEGFSFNILGHNLDDGTSCGFSTAHASLSNTDPQLDPAGLQDNGGPTQTVALCTAVGVPAGCTAASPAIDAGDPAVCAAAPANGLDQRGFARPGAGHAHCAIGAFEPDATAPPACVGDCSGTHAVGIDDLITLVNIVLGNAQPSDCSHGVPSGTDVDVALIVQAVANALSGCGSAR